MMFNILMVKVSIISYHMIRLIYMILRSYIIGIRRINIMRIKLRIKITRSILYDI